MELRRPETARELMQFVHAVNWLRPALPELAKLEAPLRVMLEGGLLGTKRTRRAADRQRMTAGDWTDERRWRVTAYESVWPRRSPSSIVRRLSLIHI